MREKIEEWMKEEEEEEEDEENGGKKEDGKKKVRGEKEDGKKVGGKRLLFLDGLEEEAHCLALLSSLGGGWLEGWVVVVGLTTQPPTHPPSTHLLGKVHAHFGLPLLSGWEEEIRPTLERMVGGWMGEEGGGGGGRKVSMRGLEGVVLMREAVGGEGGVGGWLEHVWVG